MPGLVLPAGTYTFKVDRNRFDPHHGYNGPLPPRGSQPFNHFQANEAREGRGHVVATPSHEGSKEHALPGLRGGGARH